MRYDIDKTYLRAFIDEQVSLVADEAYSDQGISLYDSIILTKKDDDTVNRHIDDAVRGFVTRTFDIAKIDADGIKFYVPDFDESMEDAVKSEITHFIVFAVCAALFKSRRPQAEPEYTERAKAAVEKAVTLLKSRKSPTDLW